MKNEETLVLTKEEEDKLDILFDYMYGTKYYGENISDLRFADYQIQAAMLRLDIG